MKNIGKICVGAVLLLMMGALHAHAVTEKEALNDWNDLQTSSETLKKSMDGVVPEYAPNIISPDDDAALSALAGYDRDLKPKLTAQLDRFSGKYGDTGEMDDMLSSVVAIDWNSGKHPSTQASQIYSSLRKHMDNIEKARVNRAEALVREAEALKTHIEGFSRQVTDENFEKLKTMLATAVKFDPGNEKARVWLKASDAERKTAMAAVEKKIDEAKWPGQYANFAGPGKPDALSKSALEWMRKDEKAAGRKDTTFAVAVRGDWVSAKKNLLGQTVQWGLPIWAACYSDDEKAKGVCRVFSLTILTREGGSDIKKEPPWTYTWVGDNYTMRLKNIKGAGVDSGSVPGASRTGAGYLVGIILRLLLGLGNIAAGFLAAAPLLKPRVPALNPLYEKAGPLSTVIGFSVLVISLFVFIKNLLFHFAPLADILPILSGAAVGLVLGKKMLMDLLSKTKAGTFAVNLEKHTSMLEGVQVQLGVASLALGVTHLLAGGLWLL